MRKSLLYSFLIFAACTLCSCRPKGVISAKELTDVLVDVHIAEALTDTSYRKVPTEWYGGLKPVFFRDMLFQSVFRKHNITEKEFYQSIGYYSRDLRKFSKIYANVNNRLVKLERDIDSWRYSNPTNLEFFEMFHMDTLKIHTVFTDLDYFRDTTYFYMSCAKYPGTTPTYLEWQSRCWFHKKINNIPGFTIMDSLRYNPYYFHYLPKPVKLKPESENIKPVQPSVPSGTLPEEASRTPIIRNVKGERVDSKGNKIDNSGNRVM